MVADFNFPNTLDALNGQATVTNQVAIALQDHRPEAMAVLRVASNIAGDPLLDPGTIQRRWIETHRLDIPQNCTQSVHIVWAKLPQNQSWCFKNIHEI